MSLNKTYSINLLSLNLFFIFLQILFPSIFPLFFLLFFFNTFWSSNGDQVIYKMNKMNIYIYIYKRTYLLFCRFHLKCHPSVLNKIVFHKLER